MSELADALRAMPPFELPESLRRFLEPYAAQINAREQERLSDLQRAADRLILDYERLRRVGFGRQLRRLAGAVRRTGWATGTVRKPRGQRIHERRRKAEARRRG